jgi:hypothetical protein
MAILPPQGAALPASDASWIMLKEVMPSGAHAAQLAELAAFGGGGPPRFAGH